MKYTVLIVEDEKPIADILSYGFRREGFFTDTAYTGAAGFQKVMERRPDLVLLDWMLPDLEGVELCRMITEQYNIPIIMLTARGTVDNRLEGLSAGADDYIAKPFDLREVIMRARTILRRIEKARERQAASRPEEYAGGLQVSREEHRVLRGGKEVELTPREYDLLLYFLDHPRQVMTRELLLEQVWGYEYAGDTRTVDIHVQRIRKKCGLSDHLQTVYGVGYRYSDQPAPGETS